MYANNVKKSLVVQINVLDISTFYAFRFAWNSAQHSLHFRILRCTSHSLHMNTVLWRGHGLSFFWLHSVSDRILYTDEIENPLYL